MHFASANHNQGREHFQPIELLYSVLATWWKYREPSVKIHYFFSLITNQKDKDNLESGSLLHQIS